MDVQSLQAMISEWADEQFPQRQPQHLLAKMLEEIGELFANPGDPMEAADLAILLLDYFHLIGCDMETAVAMKMDINRKRDWKMNRNTMIMSHVDNDS